MSESVIPGYRVLKKVGIGGMAHVYIAIQTAVGRTVALKILPRTLCNDSDVSRLFLREANCGVLNHPNIITIYDAGETKEHLYIAMEYMDGGDLKQKIKAGLDEEQVINIVVKLSEALAYAHSKGFVHRDIKPGNVVFNEDKQPVLADFGIAKAISFSEQTIADGIMLGTPHYTSPEQVSSDKVDHRTDLYSLGVMYYEMLTGQKPYQAETPFALIYKHLEEPVPPLDEQFKEHEPIIHKLMAKKPGDRYASAFDLIEDMAILTRAKKEQAAIHLANRNAKMRTYKSAAVLLTLVLAFSVIVSDTLSDYTEKQLQQIKAFAAKTAMFSRMFANELEEKKILLARQKKEISLLHDQLSLHNVTGLHLNRAALYLEKEQYISPRSMSALTEYDAILKIDPDNLQARAGIKVITDYFHLMAKNETTKGAYFDALDYIDSGLIASPADDELLHLRDRIIKRLDVSEKRMHLEGELLKVKSLIKNEAYEEAIARLEFLQDMSKNNQRILSLLTLATDQHKQKQLLSGSINLTKPDTGQ